MKNQDYFDKVLKLFRDLKRDHPDVEISKHYALATDCGSFSLTDKELYLALQKHKAELDMNTLSNKDLERVIADTNELFQEIEPEDQDDWHPEWDQD